MAAHHFGRAQRSSFSVYWCRSTSGNPRPISCRGGCRLKLMFKTRKYAGLFNMKRTFLFAVGGLALGTWAIARLAGGRFSFADKVILITGGSRGLGLVIARRMAREGGR